MDPMSGSELSDDTVSVLSDVNLVKGFTLADKHFVDAPLLSHDPNPRNLVTSAISDQGELCEDIDFCNVVLKYISQMLMEEDMDDKNCMFQESWSALQAAERSFYEVIGEKYPPSPKDQLPPPFDLSFESSDEHYTGNCSEFNYSSWNGVNNLEDPRWNCNSSEYISCKALSTSADCTSQSSFRSSSNEANLVDGFVDYPGRSLGAPGICGESKSIIQSQGGVEEASKFLPKDGDSFVNLNNNLLLPNEPKREAKAVVVAAEVKKQGIEYSLDGSKGKKNPRGTKNPHVEDVDSEAGRSSKLSAVYTESTARTEVFDMMLLCAREKAQPALDNASQNRVMKNMHQNSQLKGSTSRKGRGAKQGGKRNLVDLRTLLILCGEAIAVNDQLTVTELLKQIREHSSPTGDGMQRLATYFSNGLEARLAGRGSQIDRALFARRSTAADILKAHRLFLAVCPFQKIANFFLSKIIMQVAEKATRLHIIDFGISYGYHWPSFIEQLSARPGVPPKLRITGIEFPLPGFRPAEMVEETGCRLANYAESFNVPFEFNSIAKKWEMIHMDDIMIDREEVLVVSCIFRLKSLLDETVMLESPRDMVLNLIRKMNPDVFIHGVVNANYGAPFFLTRFREAVFHYSSLFDMFESVVPRDIPERMLVEKELIGREAMNVIAYEGLERIERPETYKQWQARNIRAGFRQLPLNREIVRAAKECVKSGYHKDFIVDLDGQWLLQGWKGRIHNGLSAWKPLH
ncbi:scarecrow-like protein 14 [Malania oleifera]|uniref:scarecrow-like protein 14 n=1 Tax=Malania oleifera TaxID=397392 RepID=UPI0025AE8F20|nr:scarecrow-like protein 14 [Malania oleifera]